MGKEQPEFPREFRLTYNLRIVISGLILAIGGIAYGILEGVAGGDGHSVFPPVVIWIRNGFAAVLLIWLAWLWLSHSRRRYYLEENSLTVPTLFSTSKIEFDAETEYYHETDSVEVPIGGTGVESLIVAGAAGLIIGALDSINLPEEATRHLHTTVWREGRSISIDSNVKGCGKLRRALIAAELVHTFPSIRDSLAAGDRISFGKKITLQGATIIAGNPPTPGEYTAAAVGEHSR